MVEPRQPVGLVGEDAGQGDDTSMAIYLNGSFMFVSGYFYTYKGKTNIVNPIIR